MHGLVVCICVTISEQTSPNTHAHTHTHTHIHTGRDWGAAWDFEVQTANAPPPPAPTTPPPSSLAGTFKFTQQNCQNDAPNCACLAGEITVKHTPGAATAEALVQVANYPPQIVTLKQPNPGAYTANYVLSRCGTGDQDIDITVSPNGNTGKPILNIGVKYVILCIC